jgi:ABC-type Fe3+/spermidine/putrescine transport system ATPase subunit
MDEPLGALDRNLREQLQGEIKRIQRDLGVTVLYVTHDQEEALTMSDRLAIMREGRIAQLGPPDEVYARPASPFAARFLGESNFIPVRRVGGDAGSVMVETEGAKAQRFAAVSGPAGLPAGAVIGMIRPEAVRLGAAAPTGATVPATIERIEHLGPTVRLTLATAFGRLTARLSRTDCPENLAPGAAVVAGWRASDLILYAREDAQDVPRW